jgi:hypothetical protein
MPNVTGSDTYFSAVSSDFTATQWESCIEQAIDAVNGALKEGDLLPQMTGTAGSKTVSLTSAQAGWIRELAVAVYSNMQSAGASSSSDSVGGISSSQSNSSQGGVNNVMVMAREAADALKVPDVSYG